MNILIDTIYAPAHGRPTDFRYEIWKSVGEVLRHRGHKIWTFFAGGKKNIPWLFPKLPEDFHRRIDFYISHSPYDVPERANRFAIFKRRKIPIMVYDHGWLPESIVSDRKKLFGDSYYFNTLGNILEEYTTDNHAVKYREFLLENNLSKRPQTRIDPIPCEDYIFVPEQALRDVSVVYYGGVGMKEFVRRVVKWAKPKNIQVVYKHHPGLSHHFESHGKQELINFANNMIRDNDNFHVVNTSIYDLMSKAKFTACINSGSIIDNLTTLTPVSTCGTSFFSNSGAVFYDSNIERGLEVMNSVDYDTKKMKERQLKLLWWLRQHMIQREYSGEENIKRIEFFSGIKL